MTIDQSNSAYIQPASQKRLVILGDSLAMPRVEEGVEILWEHTWPSLMGASLREDFEVLNFSTRAKNSNQLINPTLFLENIELVNPNIIITQVGIVDCAPRIFSNREKRMLKYIPKPIRTWIINNRSAKRQALTAKSPLAKVEVSPDKFRYNFEQFAAKVENLCKVDLLVVPILANISHMEMKSPGFAANLNLYNTILRKLDGKNLKYLNCAEQLLAAVDNFCPDGYHLSKQGNQHLCELLTSFIKHHYDN